MGCNSLTVWLQTWGINGPHFSDLDVVQSHPPHKTCFNQYCPHQVHWSDQEMGTAISCTKASQVTSHSQLLDNFQRLFSWLLHKGLSVTNSVTDNHVGQMFESQKGRGYLGTVVKFVYGFCYVFIVSVIIHWGGPVDLSWWLCGSVVVPVFPILGSAGGGMYCTVVIYW